MKKKWLAFGCALTLMASAIVGCSKTSTNQQGNGGAAGTGTELQIGVEGKGYGDEWAYKLAEAFQEKTGIKTVVAKSNSGEWILPAVTAGARYNEIDVFFDIRDTAMSDVAKVNYIDGYERAYIDLSELYNSVPEGYNTDKTLKELFDPYAVRACTWDLDGEGFGDGKQYFINYVDGMEGLVYNVKLFKEYKLTVPKTTNQFFELMEQMKTLDNGKAPKNKDGRTIYPYVFSSTCNYQDFITRVWWAQYDGITAFENVFRGQDAQGNYTADSQKSAGKLSALTHLSKLLAQDNKYYDLNAASQNFTNVQVKFLDNQAFMITTGDWLEREMAGNFANADIEVAFMRIPVNSDVIKKCDSVKTEEQLVEVLTYIDGETSEKPSYLSDKDLAYLTEARSINSSEGNQHIAYIPAYSNMVEEAKQFLSFMLSKEGQEIMLKYANGNMAPLNVDVTQFAEYKNISSLQKAKYTMKATGSGMQYIGQSKHHPMAYAGGCREFLSPIETPFSVVKTSASYMTPLELWEKDYKSLAKEWNDKVEVSGISNIKK